MQISPGNPLGPTVQGNEIAIASQAQGDILYFNGTSWVRLAKGNALQVLRQNVGQTAPEWWSLVTGSWTKVEEKIVSGGAVQSLDFDATLDGDADKSYIIEANIYNPTAGASNYNWRLNGADIAANSETYDANGAGIAAFAADLNIAGLNASQWANGFGYIPNSVSNAGNRRILSQFGFNTGNERFFGSSKQVTTPTDATKITSIGIHASVAGAIGNGTIIRLYKSG